MQEILRQAAALTRLRQSKDEIKKKIGQAKINQIELTEQEIVDAMVCSQVQKL